MEITINGEKHSFDKALTVSQLIEFFELDTEKVAVERNLEVVPTDSFNSIVLADNDAIEIIHFIGGG